jgi:hypothetical protein
LEEKKISNQTSWFSFKRKCLNWEKKINFKISMNHEYNIHDFVFPMIKHNSSQILLPLQIGKAIPFKMIDRIIDVQYPTLKVFYYLFSI